MSGTKQSTESVLANRLRHIILLLLLLQAAVLCTKIDIGNSDAFERFLRKAMRDYPAWLKRNDLDPSPLTSTKTIMLKIYQGVHLECNISNHYMTGHSRTGGEEIATFSFDKLTFSMGRTIPHLHEFHGFFTCTGALRKYTFSELKKDLVFRGNGSFLITAYNALETLSMRNVGISSDYKLDLTNSFSDYQFQTTQESVEVNGRWDEGIVNANYSEQVREAFAYLHKRITVVSDNHRSFPSGQLLDRYMRRVIKSVKIRVNNNILFGRYLNATMNAYTGWLKENALDPYPLKNGRMNGTHGRVQLDCVISKHFMRDHSNGGQNSGNSDSNFDLHTFSMGRTIQNLYEFTGNYFCKGAMTAHNYDQWASDIMFNGRGDFRVTANYSFEFLKMDNVGITPEYKLDFTYSTPTYLLPVSQTVSWLTGKWNESMLSSSGSTHLDHVQEAFANLYKNFTEEKHPSGELLKIFMRKVAKRINLRQIIDEEDLPEPCTTAPPEPQVETPLPSSRPSKKRNEEKASEKVDVISIVRPLLYSAANYFVLSNFFGRTPTITFIVFINILLYDKIF